MHRNPYALYPEWNKSIRVFFFYFISIESQNSSVGRERM